MIGKHLFLLEAIKWELLGKWCQDKNGSMFEITDIEDWWAIANMKSDMKKTLLALGTKDEVGGVILRGAKADGTPTRRALFLDELFKFEYFDSNS